MKTILAFAALILIPLSSGASLEQCEWTENAPRRFRCNEQNYIIRKISCKNSGSSEAFCEERYGESPVSCLWSESPELAACKEKLASTQKVKANSEQDLKTSKQPTEETRTAPPKSQATEAEHCKWKEPGIAYHACENETFAFGHMSCEDRGEIPNLFCKATYKDNLDACRDDNDPKTIRCLKSLMGMRPKKSTNPPPSAPTGAIQ